MKQLALTQGRVALVDDSDYEYLNQWRWYALFNACANGFYAVRSSRTNDKRKTILMHRDIMGISDPKMQVDHINHDTLNNQRNNIRIATCSENNANRKPGKNSSSKYKGVSWNKNANKWGASIEKMYKKVHLGYFINEIDAALVYNKKATELFGEFANLNKI